MTENDSRPLFRSDGLPPSRAEDYETLQWEVIQRRWDQKAVRWDADLEDQACHLHEDDAYRRFLAAADAVVAARAAFCGRQLLVDLGCGTGLVLAHFLDRFAAGLGLDLSPRMLRRAAEKRLPRTRLLAANGFSLAALVAQAGAVFSRGILLSHYGRQQAPALLQQVRQVLEPRGGFAILDFLNAAARQRYASNPDNKTYYEANDVERLDGAARGVLFHCDATQWAGRLPLDVERLGLDALSLSAHKMYGPKGAGAAYVSERILHAGLVPQLLGGGQEAGFRSGTLNVPAIVGLGAACTLAGPRMEADAARTKQLARLLFEGLAGQLDGVTLNGHPQQRLPGGLHVTIAGVDSAGLIASVPELAFSSGSACETDQEPDYVLKAIGRPAAAHHSVRFQIGRTTTREDVLAAVQLLVAGVQRMRAFAA